MQESGILSARSELKVLVAEASEALALLDAARLEELALCCKALNRNLEFKKADAETRSELARQAREAQSEMAILGRALEATRANLNVMKRLRDIRLGELEYKAQWGAANWLGVLAEDGNGNH